MRALALVVMFETWSTLLERPLLVNMCEEVGALL
jgi:hypothetical protein